LFDEGGFPIRLRVAIPVHERKELASYIQKHGRGNEWLQWDMVKIFLDGSIGSNTAWMLEEYLGHPGDCGLVVTQREEFLRQVRECNEENLKVLVHAIGDAAVRTALDVFEECGPGFYRMEHAQHIHPDDLPRFAELGVIPCVQPIHLSDDGRWAEGILGEKRASQSFPFAGLIKSGALLAGGTDWPIAPASPWLNLHAAVARQTNDGSNPDGWYPSQALSLEQALLMSTVSCAQASGEGSCLGMLSPGHWADFAILDRDLFSAPIDCLPNVNVIHRRIAGKQI
jgi:hypothetical protein